MLTMLTLMLWTAPLDCGAQLSLDVTPSGVAIRSGARSASFQAPAGFTPKTCAWSSSTGLMHAASDDAQWLFRVQWPGVVLVKTGSTQDAHPWTFTPATGEIHQENPVANHCDGRPVRINQRRMGKGGWEPVPHTC